MTQVVIAKSRLNHWAADVAAGAEFYGPVRRDGAVALERVTAGQALDLDYVNFTLPPKRMFLPRSEVIATHEAQGMVEAPLKQSATVVFGVRPCDALALTYLDKVFIDEKFVDPYYQARRRRTVVIALACRRGAATCFCTSVGGDPAGHEGADVLAVDIGDALALESFTSEGEKFLAAQKGLKAPSASQLKARDEQTAAAAPTVSAAPADGVTERLQASGQSQAWDDLARRCLGCGACTFLCPTCHCFGLYDEEVGRRCRRVRAQDACMFTGFTQEASGHNPRTRQGLRMRQRVMHKFRYAAESFGRLFCVGCGRCIEHCPANMDIRETLSKVPQ